MRILHFILGKASKARANGVNQVVAGLAKYTNRQPGCEVRVIGKTHSVAPGGETIPRDGFSAEVFPGWAPPLRAHLQEAIAWADVVHLHGGYSPWNILVGRMCQRAGSPYVVTLHNALSPELIASSGRTRKFLFDAAFQRRHLEAAAALHVLTEEEGTDVQRAIRARRIVCIPNGVDLEEFPDDAGPRERQRGPGDPIVVGYLGRLSHEKNLDAFIAAVVEVRKTRAVHLVLAGPATAYGSALEARFGSDTLQIAGPLYGMDKAAFVRNADLFVIPSLSEGFSVAAAEVLALGTPLLITRTSKLTHYYDRRPFFMCEPTAFGIERGLRRAIELRGEWNERSINGRRLVEDEFNWSRIAERMTHAYERVLQGVSQ